MTPRRDQLPSGTGPGSRSTSPTRCPRRARPTAPTIPVGPAPTTTVSMAPPPVSGSAHSCRSARVKHVDRLRPVVRTESGPWWEAAPMDAPVMLLDSASLWFRAFYGVPATLTAEDGTPVNAVRG